jgi:hypothetical protein
MLRRIVNGQMPPGDPLSNQDTETIRRWIEGGAPWKDIAIGAVGTQHPRAGLDWWSIQPLANEAVCQNLTALRVSSPPRPSTASFIANLKKKECDLLPRADRRTYIRRATSDLLGLPTPEEVKAFEENNSPDAYGKLIDRLLASPHYG